MPFLKMLYKTSYYSIIKVKVNILIIFSLLLFTLTIHLYSQDNTIAENFLRRAFFYHGTENNNKMSLELLEKAYGYSKSYPEYYYTNSMILNESVPDNIEIIIKMADEIVNYYPNNFLIDRYSLLKRAGAIYKRYHIFDKYINVYDRIFNIRDRDLSRDYLDFIDTLILTGYHREASGYIATGLKLFSNPEFYYYYVINESFKGNSNKNELQKIINRLDNNLTFSKAKVYYLKILNSEFGASLYEELAEKKEAFKTDKRLFKHIVYHFLQFEDLSDDQIAEVLGLWEDVGGLKDWRTDQIISLEHIKTVIEENNELDDFIKFTGNRSVDIDFDNRYEINYTYENGSIIRTVYDTNQDGIIEKDIAFFKNGEIKEFIRYNSHKDFEKYVINSNDASLLYIEIWEDNEFLKKIVLETSTFFPEEDFNSLTLEKTRKHFDYIESFNNNTYTKEKFYNGELVYIYEDFDGGESLAERERFYEYKKVFENNTIIEGLKDTNFDKSYDTVELYKNGKLSLIQSKRDPLYKKYDYEEEFFTDYTEKRWDDNHDGIFENVLIHFDNGRIIKKFDIDFDGQYDHQTEISEVGKNNSVVKDKNNKWFIVTSNNYDILRLPDDIIFKDKKKGNGIYIYKNKKFYFTDNIIKNSDFKFEIKDYNGELYLINRSL